MAPVRLGRRERRRELEEEEEVSRGSSGGGSGGGAGAGYALGGESLMAEEESDQEAERLGEELVAIVESPPGPVGLRASGDGRGGSSGIGCGGGVGISSRDYCRRFCQVRRPSAAPTCHRAPGPLSGSWPSGPRIWAVSGTEPQAGQGGSRGSPGSSSAPLWLGEGDKQRVGGDFRTLG